jgi:SAM-dependent methyltransferase
MTYRGLFADWYDLFHAQKDYPGEAAFIHQLLQDYGAGPVRRLLDIACGSGKHALALEPKGYQITGVDQSADMIVRARHNAAVLGSRASFLPQDMRELDAGGPFDAAICLFDSIGYVVTNEGLEQSLGGVGRHLVPGGLFLVEFWHGPAMLLHHDPVRVRRWDIPQGELIRISETRLDVRGQLSRVKYSMIQLNHNGTYATFAEEHVNRYFSVPEMAGWLTGQGFEPLKWFAGFKADETITSETWHVLAVARRRNRR